MLDFADAIHVGADVLYTATSMIDRGQSSSRVVCCRDACPIPIYVRERSIDTGVKMCLGSISIFDVISRTLGSFAKIRHTVTCRSSLVESFYQSVTRRLPVRSSQPIASGRSGDAGSAARLVSSVGVRHGTRTRQSAGTTRKSPPVSDHS